MEESIHRELIFSVNFRNSDQRARSSAENTDAETCTCARCKFTQLLTELGLQEFYPNRLSLSKVLEINVENLEDKVPACPKDIPWHFLRMLMGANSAARTIDLLPTAELTEDTMEEDDFDIFSQSSKTTTASFNPLDIISAVFLCADTFLQQELVLKMSLCQFAVPILLPHLEWRPTFLLRPMRSIVRRYRPQSMRKKDGFLEECMATSDIPTFAFARLGRCSLSKSKMLNYIFSNSQQQQNYFVHSDMTTGDIPRMVSDGLIEMCWYLPYGSEDVDVIQEALGIMNLRGDAQVFPEHFRFLTKVATAVFVFIDHLNKEVTSFLSTYFTVPQQLFLLVNPNSRQMEITKLNLKKLVKSEFIEKNHILLKSQKNEATFAKMVRSKLVDNLRVRSEGPEKAASLQAMASVAREVNFLVDEDEIEFSKARKTSEEILHSIPSEDIEKFKETHLYFQGVDWKEISDIEKELCRLRRLRGQIVADYVADLKKQRHDLCKRLVNRGMSDVMKKMIEVLQIPSNKRKHFLNWLKYELDSRSRTLLQDLHEQCMELNLDTQNEIKNPDIQNQQTELIKKLIDSSLGLEHFFREMGLIYEVFQTWATIPPNIKTLPSIAADLMLDGFPLELMDGDVSNIPVEWVTAVFNELEKKVGPCRIFVLSVLGVQSSGKSTLLNTMFGLQFAVGCGRCTRGVYMQLIKTTGAIQKCGCDFILILDTEGLEAQELARVGGTHEHDNELATLVTGLSDLTLINMSTESASEMKEVLQIVVHAFIRMRIVGKRPNCQFIHQNIGDVSAHQKNAISRKLMQEELDKMARIAAEAEKEDCHFSKFSDVLDYDSERNNWYIPGLWCGTPPMAAVNTGYSQKVRELKQNIVKCFLNRRPSTITDFIRWMRSTWNGVKHENFIFSFRNSLIANAYNQLSVKYSDLEWKMRSEINSWLETAQNRISNVEGDLQDLRETLNNELLKVINEMKSQMLIEMEEYFNSDTDQAHLIENFKAEMKVSFESVCLNLETHTKRKCEEAVIRHEGLNQVNHILRGYTDKIQEKVDQLLHVLKLKSTEQTDSELSEAFGKMWTETMATVCYEPVVININRDMENSLRENMRTHGSVLTEKLASGKSLLDMSKMEWNITKQHIDVSTTSLLKRFAGKTCKVSSHVKDGLSYMLGQKKGHVEKDETVAWVETNCLAEAGRNAGTLISQSKEYVQEMVQKGKEYKPLLCIELLRELDEKLQKLDGEIFKVNELFRTDVKIHICGFAVQRFQEMHDRFCDKHNPRKKLEDDRKYYFEMFKNLYSEKDQSEACAKLFCESCLKPALLDDLDQRLGSAIVENIRKKGKVVFKSRRNLQVGIMLDLKKQNSFAEYSRYIGQTRTFEKDWVKKQVLNHCKILKSEQSVIYWIAAEFLRGKINLMQQTIEDIIMGSADDVENFLDKFKRKLGDHIVFPPNKLENKIAFKNAPSFVTKLTNSIPDLEKLLLQSIEKWDVNQKVLGLPTDPSKELYQMLSGCGEHCPFCQVPCDLTSNNHEKHSATYHWPQGIGGCHWRRSKALVTESCTATATELYWYRTEGESFWRKIGRFFNELFFRMAYIETQSKRCDSWKIPTVPEAEIPSYWKWVFYTCNTEFAKKYKLEPAANISDWNIPWEKIKSDLEKEYDVKIVGFSLSPQLK